MPRQFEYTVTREQARQLDRIAMDRYGVEGVILMENAGRACAREGAEIMGGAEGRSVAVLCGKGNNGGDGFVIARHLQNWGARVRCWIVGSIDAVLRGGGEAALNLKIALNMDIPVAQITGEADLTPALDGAEEADLVVDALLGTGVAGEVRGPYKPLIMGLNDVEAPVLAVDVPSGLDCDTGEPLGVAVRADRTVTFVLSKRGFTTQRASAYTGVVRVAEISVPRAAIEQKIAEWQRGGK